jgi:hypothetical protein
MSGMHLPEEAHLSGELQSALVVQVAKEADEHLLQEILEIGAGTRRRSGEERTPR